MKGLRLLVLGLVVMGFSTSSVFAQDEITDEQLRKYALLDEVITLMKKDISVEINELIKKQEGIDGKRFKELSATKGDETKLAALNATDFEKQFLTNVLEFKAKRVESIKTVNSELAKNMVGDSGKTYKAIKAALKTDEALKARYEAVKNSLANEVTAP